MHASGVQTVSLGVQKVSRNELGLTGKGKGRAIGPKGELNRVGLLKG